MAHIIAVKGHSLKCLYSLLTPVLPAVGTRFVVDSCTHTHREKVVGYSAFLCVFRHFYLAFFPFTFLFSFPHRFDTFIYIYDSYTANTSRLYATLYRLCFVCVCVSYAIKPTGPIKTPLNYLFIFFSFPIFPTRSPSVCIYDAIYTFALRSGNL